MPDWDLTGQPPWVRRNPDAITECDRCDDDGIDGNGHMCNHGPTPEAICGSCGHKAHEGQCWAAEYSQWCRCVKRR
jgi:hypothetical protein